jgi:hypothetical protein
VGRRDRGDPEARGRSPEHGRVINDGKKSPGSLLREPGAEGEVQKYARAI